MTSRSHAPATDAEHLFINYRQAVAATLQSLPAAGFERFCQRLLRESGFEEVTIAGRSGDGGIDGIGLLQVNPLVSFKVLFQCKRYSGSVTPSQVRDFRGAMMGRADKGIIITTGSFTSDARKEAVRDGVPPIELVDGEKLVSMDPRHAAAHGRRACWRQAAERGVSGVVMVAPPRSEHGDHDQRAHATVRTPREVAEGCLARGLVGRRRGNHGEGGQQGPRPGPIRALRGAPEPVVADLGAAAWQDVLEEALEKLHAGQRDVARLMRPIVLIAKRHVVLGHLLQSAVRDRDAEHIPTQLVEDSLTAAGVLGVDHPRRRPDPGRDLVE